MGWGDAGQTAIVRWAGIILRPGLSLCVAIAAPGYDLGDVR